MTGRTDDGGAAERGGGTGPDPGSGPGSGSGSGAGSVRRPSWAASDGGFGGTDGWKALASRYALVPLRIFLGVTFLYAGLDKLTTAGFLADTGPGSIGELMRGVRDTSALPALVDLALRNPVGFGYAIALGELLVGIGTLFGLYARVAALGGALISLSLWLTVSWQVNPYYLGNDLAYLMSWLPLLLAGAPVFSLDALLSERRRIP
ncbi:DoxX family protein [Streptomyces showdoensis]|uniref:Membrane protein n=1 Tax=Streptomyces showdoensis TaxID=68268 RepID=A0A2P2GDG4_STREW|nr:DoxX family protein [Streptomyces showdoensis]KKZ69523.1 membrane protein [Streptomyces showdoensis]